MRAQNFEKRTEGDLKEGFYLGKDLDLNHPNVVAKKFGQAPNKYPSEVADPEFFKKTVDAYHSCLTELAKKILEILALSLNMNADWFSEYTTDPVAVLRLLHYPPQAPDASALERGI